MLRVLVVGQTPPPYGGQAVMIENLMKGSFDGVRLFHVRMQFTKDMAQVGQLHLSKYFHLIQVILKVIYYRFRYRTGVLYYPPAGPNRIPIIRDLFILLATRWLFQTTIFHFHAGGLGSVYLGLSRLWRPFFRAAYFDADVGIRVSRAAPNDPKALMCRREVLIPNAISDACRRKSPPAQNTESISLLYVGLISEEKGLLTLIDACSLLHARGINFEMNMVGSFSSTTFEQRLRQLASEKGISELVRFKGALNGHLKWNEYSEADIFCFPTHHPSETFGIVTLEAMSFGLPVVASEWRANPEIIMHGKTGLLVRHGDSMAFSRALATLAGNVDFRRRLGQSGRRRFEECFSLDRFWTDFQKLFESIDKNLLDE